jgi:hypothetical protein
LTGGIPTLLINDHRGAVPSKKCGGSTVYYVIKKQKTKDGTKSHQDLKVHHFENWLHMCSVKTAAALAIQSVHPLEEYFARITPKPTARQLANLAMTNGSTLNMTTI